MGDFSFLANAHPGYIESLYQQYLRNPESIDAGWSSFFRGFDYAMQSNGHAAESTAGTGVSADIAKELAVYALIEGYRHKGHLLSDTNPIRKRKDRKPHLDLSDFGLHETDLDSHFAAGAEIGLTNPTLRQILDKLKDIYCSTIGFEWAHIEHYEKKQWLKQAIEVHSAAKGHGLNLAQKKHILEKLNGAVVFEKFLHTKYVGQKRFSLEGGETTIAALDAMIRSGAAAGVEEFIFGMAHRGRLNVLANILGKTYQQIFNEFEGTAIPDLSFGDGDVKYHLGFSSIIKMDDGKEVHLKLVPNPSHLESVNPVVEGFARAKADILYKSDYDRVMPILIHGDAAAAGQGVVYETVQMSQLKGYYTGGTIHFVINNQIGFTTDWDDARSSTYSTAAAALVQAPVFHVNGDDPEAVVYATELAVAYRQHFNTDVFIDMVCYRRHGHNEGDDPKFTQPHMYEVINRHPDPREIYSKKLMERGDVEKEMAESLERSFWEDLQSRLDEVKQNPLPYQYQEPEQAWRKLKKKTDPSDYLVSPETGVDAKVIGLLAKHLLEVPEGFTPLPKVNRLLKSMGELMGQKRVDWALAELMAYGSLLLEGKDVRLSGQDVKRGTFSHRHAVLRDSRTNEEYNRLDSITETQGRFRIFNSLLSEFAALGFEYGYSLSTPDALVLWEAQFGDFYNGAQTIVDQYIFAAESKWQRMSGIVMLLPHGYEGQGPEHSSARLERFLQSCAEYNVTVANVSTPANFFHLLRRQLYRPFRKPLVVMSPKSLLRHPLCISTFEEMQGATRFQEILDDPHADAKKVKRVLCCSGKIYYDLHQKREETKDKSVAIVRIEQLYPLPMDKIEELLLKKYAKAEKIWVQEEPANMGAWAHIAMNLPQAGFRLVSRKASASPASGFKKVHDMQQEEIVRTALGIG